MSSPFATYSNATLRFQVASGELVTDPATGNVKPGVAVVEVGAMLQQRRDPNREPRPGVDTSAVWCEGYITSVVGQSSLVLPSVVTIDAVCAATWQGRQGRFYMEFTARNPYIAALGIDLVERIRGYFQLGSFVVGGEPWSPSPVPSPTAQSYEKRFTQADVSIVGLLGVVHLLGSYPSAIAVFDESGFEVQPDGWHNISVNEIAVDLTSFAPIQGVWTISVTS